GVLALRTLDREPRQRNTRVVQLVRRGAVWAGDLHALSVLGILEPLLEGEIRAVGVDQLLRTLARVLEPRVHHPARDLRRVLVVEAGQLGELVQVERVVLLLHLDVEEKILDQLIRTERPAAAVADEEARLL